MAAPTDKELPILEKFRSEISDLCLKDEQETDIALLSWLRARDLDISKASEMLRQSLKWRQANDLENILNFEPPAHYMKEYAFEVIGSDHDGHSICVIPLGVWDIRKIISSGERETFLKYFDLIFAQQIENLKEKSKILNKEVSQFIFIVDFAELSMRQLTSFATVDSLLEVVRRFEANYPERLYSCYFINASRIFSILFSLMKPLLTARTLSKIQVYSKPSQWKPVLLRDLPADQLPKEYGGTKPGTGRRVSIGDKRISLETGEPGFITVKVGAGKKLDLEFGVTQPKTKISWNFKTEGYDIGFSVTLDRKTEILGYRKYDSHIKPETGEIICDSLGEYFLTFDNSYSKMREKTIHYLIDFSEPSQGEILEE